MKKIWKKINKCRICNNKNLYSILDLGNQPPANSLKSKFSSKIIEVPLHLVICKNCKTLQLNATVDSDYLFKNYNWISGNSKEVHNHKKKFYNNTKKYITKKSFVLEIASNDGTFLKYYKQKGHKILGVDPAKNIALLANSKKIQTIPKFFNRNTSEKILKTYGKPDLIFARNVIPHVNNIHEVIKSISLLCSKNTKIAIEFHYSEKILKELHYDSIYHEHIFYFSIKSLSYLLNIYSLKIFDVFKSPISGGSLVLMISKERIKKSTNLINIIDNERKIGLNTIKQWRDFGKKSIEHSKILYSKIVKYTSNKKILAYGASARSSTLLNYINIDHRHISIIIDSNTIKHNKYTPKSNIKILPISKIKNLKKENVILILAWNFKDEIVSILHKKKFKGKIIIPLPNKVKII